jgi:xylulokinase
MGQLLLGIDVGTYSSKGVLVAPEGTVLRAQTVDHDMAIPHPGWAEQDADQVWWHDVVVLCQALLDGRPYRGDDVAGVAVSAIGPCLLPLDAHDRPPSARRFP